jgi:hypothetical protein
VRLTRLGVILEDELVTDDLRSLSDDSWLARIGQIGAAAGSFEALGARHSAVFSDQGSVLLVSFESIAAIRRSGPDQLPMAFRTAEQKNWSSLSLIADGETWFRDPAVFAYFDRLVDEAFFEDFDQVVFYGAGMAGYAAAAFSVAAPGATVIILQPQATLDPLRTGWDPRFAEHRRIEFTGRYGYAPDMTEGAGPVFVIYDPDQSLDAMHAALFARPWVTLLPCPHVGRDVAGALAAMRVLPSILSAACTGVFDRSMFRTFYRSRRNHPPYLRTLMAKLDTDGRPLLNAILCRNVVQRLNGPKFRARLTELTVQLERAGVRIPPTRVG